MESATKTTEGHAVSSRQNQILEMVRERGFVSSLELSRVFEVTPQTIRRDINELSEQGLLTRYHGGAGNPSSVENVAYSTRQVLNQAEKDRIAQEVARHIPDKASLFLNIGTTTEAVARALGNHKGLRIITNNLNVAAIMSEKEDFEVVIAGGVVRSRDRGIIGQATIDFIRQFRVDMGIIGISGIDLDGTLLDFDYREVRVAQAIIENSRQVLLVADHSKFGRSAMVKLGHISQVDVFYTDKAPPAPLAEVMRTDDVKVVVAGRG
ncbi:MAG: DeoR/GlpR family transcriptional regulator, partial [Proteobacteria bacterium]|nr:DeoR/GlpR family transcriptional regulator [Pseudomonadota bacterium]